jgi:hypothetical protein
VHADLGEYRWASLRAVAQKADSQANSLFHPDHRTAVCTAFPDRSRAASGALAGLGVVLRQSVAHYRASFQEPVRDSPLAMGALAPLDALQVLQPPGARKKVVFQTKSLAALQPALLAGVPLSAAQMAKRE